MASSPLAGSLLVAVGWLAVAVLGLVPTNNAFFARRIAFPLGAAAGVALAAFGLQAVWLPPQVLTLPLGLPDLPFHLRIDPLAGFFLMLLGSVSAGISVYAAGYFGNEPSGRLTLISLQYHVFLASMAFVLLADDAYLFMVAWETMALSSYFLVITDHQQPAIRSAGFLYLLIAHLGAIAILLCFGVLHGGRGDYTFDALRRALRPHAARSEAPARLPFGREHRHHPARPRDVHGVHRFRPRRSRRARPDRRALPHAQPRRVQGAPFSRSGLYPSRHGPAQPERHGRPHPRHAEDRVLFPDRRARHLGVAALERIRLGVADLPGRPASDDPSARRRAEPLAAFRRDSRPRGRPDRDVLRQGLRHRVSRPTARAGSSHAGAARRRRRQDGTLRHGLACRRLLRARTFPELVPADAEPRRRLADRAGLVRAGARRFGLAVAGAKLC